MQIKCTFSNMSFFLFLNGRNSLVTKCFKKL
nr:MAG TPA: hypothetical protein [Caudoviricetes sp.]